MLARDRFVIAGVILMAVIAAMPVAHGFAWFSVRFGVNDPRIIGDLTLTSVVAYCIAAAAAGFCLFHQPTRQLAGEVVEELAKVTWPTREETSNATVVVIVTVLLCSLYLGLFDAAWLWITDRILGVPNG